MTYMVYLFAFLILYTYLGYPVLVILLGKLINKKIHKEKETPTVALMIAAYNEQKDISDKIQNSLALDYPQDKLKIYVVSDGSTDKTDDIVKSYASKGVKLIRIEGRVGKTQARNKALKLIDQEIVVFSDATTVYRKDVIRKLVRNFSDPNVGMVTGHLIYKDPDNTQMGKGQQLYWKYETLIKQSQTKMGTLTGSIGCISAFRKTIYTDLPANIIEDFTEPLMFILKGFRVVFESEAICHELTTKKSSQEWSMRVRVIRGGMTGLLFAKKVLNIFKHPIASFQLISHKIFRWLVPIFAILLFLTSCLAVFFETNSFVYGLFILQVFYYLTVIWASIFEKNGFHNRFLGLCYYLFIVNAASLIALVKTMTTKLEATWETQREVKL